MRKFLSEATTGLMNVGRDVFTKNVEFEGHDEVLGL
jgi:hypothetical protein